MENLGRIGLSEEQADLLEVAINFCRDKSPIKKVRSLMTDEIGYDPAIWTEIVQLGWTGIAIPVEFGGAGLGLAEVVPVMEQMGRTMMSGPFFTTTLAAQAIVVSGADQQKTDLLPKIASGAIATLALSEADSGWDLEAISASAACDGDKLVLSGKKRFVLHADCADFVIASVMHQSKPALIIIEKSAIGRSSLRRETVIDETKRSYEVTLDGVVVPASSLFVTDKAQAALRHIDLVANLLASAELVGGTQAVIDYTIDYLNTRKQFGKVIGSYQALKHPTVDAFVQYEQARSHLYSAAHTFNEQGTGEIATRMAKAQAEKALSYASDRSIQFHGGFGFTYDCDAQLYRRRAAWHSSQFGDATYQRNKLSRLLFA